ncbi:MAG: 8-amino-7-oxononanoate synthase [Bacteroidota bacterium]|nr:8-amino-7-oxononanoate synthase [Bacteroidota bacterium]
MYPDDFLQDKLNERIAQQAFRTLTLNEGKTDFCSNDYLGIVKNDLLQVEKAVSGSTGSRLLSGNYHLIEETEQQIAAFHNSEAALIFNSGYDANVGLLSSVPQKGDTIIYDQLSHASIRDGIRLSFAQAYSFAHNDVEDLEKKLHRSSGHIFVVTESLFSMDGDVCPLAAIIHLCRQYKAHLIIDEAHATGVIGDNGEGLVQQEGWEQHVFARVHTFGKAVGCHGAAILGSQRLKHYLVNFSRSLIYSTALSPHAVATISKSYKLFPSMKKERNRLRLLVQQFQSATFAYEKLSSETPIQGVVIPGNEAVRTTANVLQQNGLDVRPVLYPTVPKGKERLRIVLHSFNTEEQLQQLLYFLRK